MPPVLTPSAPSASSNTQYWPLAQTSVHPQRTPNTSPHPPSRPAPTPSTLNATQCRQCSQHTAAMCVPRAPLLPTWLQPSLLHPPAGLRGRVKGIRGRGPGSSAAPNCPAPCPLPGPDTAHAGTHVHPEASVYLGVSPAAVGGTFLAPATPALPTYNYLQPPTPARVPRGGS